MPLVSKYEDRVRDYTRNAVYKQYIKKCQVDVSQFHTGMKEFNKYLESYNGKRSWTVKEKRVRARIKKRLGIWDLFQKTSREFKKIEADNFRSVFMMRKK